MGHKRSMGRADARRTRIRDSVEVLESSLGRIARHGQYITMEGVGSPEEHAVRVAEILGQREELRQLQVDRRARLVEVLQEADPADLLGFLSLGYLMFDPDTFRESENDRSPAHLEYLALQVLGTGIVRREGVDPMRQRELAGEAIELVREMFDTATWLTMLDATEARRARPDDATVEYALKTRMHSMGVRGTGYAEHLLCVLHGCLAPFDTECRRILGFTVGDALTLFEAIRSVTAKRLEPRGREAGAARREMERMLKRARRRRDVSGTPFPVAVLSMTPTQAKQQIVALMSAWVFLDARSLAVITCEDLAEEAGLDLLTCQAFLDAFTCPPSEFNVDHHAYPVGAHPITLRPILNMGDGYLLPAPSTAIEAIRPLMEDALHKEKRVWDRYVASRGDFVELEATKRLVDALPGSEWWANVKWSSPTTNSDLDGLVRADDLGVRIQCKAGRMTAPARRGSSDRMVRNLKDLIQSAAEQHEDLATEISAHGSAALGFTDEQAQALATPLRIEVVVCLDDVTVWATETHALRKIGTLPADRHVPWVLSLTDLMAVTDLLQGGQLGHYMLRRQRLERDGRIQTHDELDWVGYYIAKGLFFDGYFDAEHPPDAFRLMSFTEMIDDWYFTRQGVRTVPADKPEQPIPPTLKQLLHRLETRRPEHWMLAAIALLDGDDDSRDKWDTGLRHVQRKAREQGWSNITQVFADRLGVTVMADFRLMRPHLDDMLTNHCRTKASDFELPNWIGIAEGVAGSLAVAVIEGNPGLGEIFMRPPPRRVDSDAGVQTP
ncbi:hypothetical protein Vwe01_62530 [Micromonospora andamanensis]|nr:hypothetical protein Vwe01_62530 [Micromonospora andamanensis]